MTTYFPLEMSERYVYQRVRAALAMTKDQQQRLERLEARKAAGKPLTRTEKFALMNLSRLRDTQQLLDQMENRQRDPRCICNAGDRHYGNCPLATPENRITGPGE